MRLTKEAILEVDGLRDSIPGTLDSHSQAVDTLYQLDQISKTVCNVIDAAELCRSAHASQQWREAASLAFHELQQYIGTLNADQRLYNSLVMVDQSFAKDMTEEEQRFCFLLKREFELDGIHLPDDQRAHVQELHQHVTHLETLFGSNITNAHKTFLVDAASVETILPRHVLEANGGVYQQDDQVRLTADTPITHSITSFANHAGLRKEVYMETMTSTPENLEVLDALIQRRHELSQALGFEGYADRFLQDKMAQSQQGVSQFLQDVQTQIAPGYQEEMTLLSQAKSQIEGNSFLEPWDLKFYVKMLKAQRGVDPNQLAPYLSLSNCLNSMQLLVDRLFGIRMQEEGMAAGEGWDVDDSGHGVPQEERIRKFVLWESESERELGTMYLDLHPRPGKYTHAAHFTVRCGCVVNGPDSEYQLPIVALVCNMNSGQASFSSHPEVETLFHEFGHALHSLLSRTKFQHLSGTRAAMDFVETPSHWMEHFVWDPEFLPILAKDADGEPMPASLVQALVDSRNQFRSLEMQNQIVLSKFDQQIFGGPANQGNTTTQESWGSLHREHQVPFAEGSHGYTNVGHLVTYGAGYYGYLYSQVFASSIWSQLFHQRPLERESGERMWKKLLMHGGSRDAQVMLEDLLGKKPTVGNTIGRGF
jgi:intermediate peptidase